MSISAMDRVEIGEWASRYTTAVDEHQPEDWVDTFAENGAVENPCGQPQGKSALREWISGLIGSLPQGTRHLTLNAMVDDGTEPNTAMMRSRSMVIGRDEAPATIGATGR